MRSSHPAGGYPNQRAVINTYRARILIGSIRFHPFGFHMNEIGSDSQPVAISRNNVVLSLGMGPGEVYLLRKNWNHATIHPGNADKSGFFDCVGFRLLGQTKNMVLAM